MTKSLIILLLVATAVVGQSANDISASVSVVGEATLSIAPDQVVFTLEAITVDKEVAKAKQSNDSVMAKLLDVTRDFRIAKEDIQTESLTVSPKYSTVKVAGGRTETQVLAGYEVNNRATVTLKDLKRIDEFLSRAVAAGINRVVSVDIENSELQKYEEQARTLAVKNAEDKARAYANRLGLQLGKAYMIREEDADQVYATGFGSGSGDGYGAGGNSDRLESPPIAFDRPITFALGRIRISEKIYVVFELKR